MNDTNAIFRIETGHYRVPLPRTLSDATHGEISAFELVTVRLTDERGEEGVGFTYTVGRGGSAIRELIDRELGPLIRPLDPRRHELLWQEMDGRMRYVGRGGLVAFAISAVDMAVHDLRAKRCGQPLWRLLGGVRERVPAYAGGVDLDFTLEELLAEVEGYRAEGFDAIKIKVGRERLEEDVERVRAVRRTLGPEMTLMVDANMRWPVQTAMRAVHALRDQDLYWLEEPIVPDDEDGHAQLAALGIPIAAGESLRSLAEFERMIRRGRLSVVQPDATNAGGITSWMKVARIAEASGVPVSSHGAHDVHAHLLAAIGNASYLEVHRFGLDRYLRRPLRLENGCAVLTDAPGIGLDFDWAALAEHAVAPATGDVATGKAGMQ